MEAEQLISGIKKLSPTPKILPELRRLLKDSESGIHDIVDLIKIDNTLSSQLVRVSNSPFYGASAPSNSVEESINRIGFHEVYKLVAFLICSGVLASKNDIYNLKPNELWEDSVSCGLVMQVLAKLVRIDQETAYTVGLMHSIGKTAINTYFRETKKTPPKFTGKDIPVELEYKVLGFSHADAGALLLTKWKFNKDTTEPIVHQFSPENAGEHEKTAYTLYLSKQIFPHLGLKPQEALEKSAIDPKVIEKLDLYEDDIIDGIIDSKTALDGMGKLIKAA